MSQNYIFYGNCQDFQTFRKIPIFSKICDIYDFGSCFQPCSLGGGGGGGGWQAIFFSMGGWCGKFSNYMGH